VNKEYALIIAQWIITIGLLIKFIPRNKIREAYIAFTFKQILTWILGLTVAELRLIEYPVRLFPYANKASFTFEYFVYPSICAIFNVNFPENKSNFSKSMYYFYYCTAITILEVLVEKHTNIIKYIHWTWHVTWITLFITFFITRRFYLWYLRQNQKSL
jgi:hypothetical protein